MQIWMIPTDLQRSGQYLTTSKGVLPRIPNGISLSSPNVGTSFQLQQNKTSIQEGMPTCPGLPAEQVETGRSEED